MGTSSLKYPKKSHRKPIKIPREPVLLAEFMGIEFGDGGISNPWQMVITLNADKDAEYALYIEKMIYNLFGIEVVFRKRGARTLQIISTSISLVDFLVKKGAMRGNKIKLIHRHAVRGVTYKNIVFCFTSFSRNLLYSVSDIFRGFGIEPHIASKGSMIYLYSQQAIEKYLKVFKSNNSRINNLYKEWRGAGVV